jgi:hypothetical protein
MEERSRGLRFGEKPAVAVSHQPSAIRKIRIVPLIGTATEFKGGKSGFGLLPLEGPPHFLGEDFAFPDG